MTDHVTYVTRELSAGDMPTITLTNSLRVQPGEFYVRGRSPKHIDDKLADLKTNLLQLIRPTAQDPVIVTVTTRGEPFAVEGADESYIGSYSITISQGGRAWSMTGDAVILPNIRDHFAKHE